MCSAPGRPDLPEMSPDPAGTSQTPADPETAPTPSQLSAFSVVASRSPGSPVSPSPTRRSRRVTPAPGGSQKRRRTVTQGREWGGGGDGQGRVRSLASGTSTGCAHTCGGDREPFSGTGGRRSAEPLCAVTWGRGHNAEKMAVSPRGRRRLGPRGPALGVPPRAWGQHRGCSFVGFFLKKRACSFAEVLVDPLDCTFSAQNRGTGAQERPRGDAGPGALRDVHWKRRAHWKRILFRHKNANWSQHRRL